MSPIPLPSLHPRIVRICFYLRSSLSLSLRFKNPFPETAITDRPYSLLTASTNLRVTTRGLVIAVPTTTA